MQDLQQKSYWPLFSRTRLRYTCNVHMLVLVTMSTTGGIAESFSDFSHAYSCRQDTLDHIHQGQIQEFVLQGQGPPLTLFPLEVWPSFKTSYGSGKRYKLPSVVWGGAPTEKEFGAFKAARKPLVAIILSILQCMFYSRTIKIQHYVNIMTKRAKTRPQLRGYVLKGFSFGFLFIKLK